MGAGLKQLWAACVALILGVVIGGFAFKSTSPASGQGAASGGERIVLVTHGQAADAAGEMSG